MKAKRGSGSLPSDAVAAILVVNTGAGVRLFKVTAWALHSKARILIDAVVLSITDAHLAAAALHSH